MVALTCTTLCDSSMENKLSKPQQKYKYKYTKTTISITRDIIENIKEENSKKYEPAAKSIIYI
jgi:hypothetical protein